MPVGTEKIIRIASDEFRKLAPQATGIEIEEIEETASGHSVVTLGYWIKDSKPAPSKSDGDSQPIFKGLSADFINPWRRRYKRVEVDPKLNKAVSIKMYEPPLGVS